MLIYTACLWFLNKHLHILDTSPLHYFLKIHCTLVTDSFTNIFMTCLVKDEISFLMQAYVFTRVFLKEKASDSLCHAENCHLVDLQCVVEYELIL